MKPRVESELVAFVIGVCMFAIMIFGRYVPRNMQIIIFLIIGLLYIVYKLLEMRYNKKHEDDDKKSKK